jgi:glycosyltransferase involved in cell wall biosynthesis
MVDYVREFWGQTIESNPKEIIITNKNKLYLDSSKCDITIGVPTFKRAKLLERLLNSLARQNLKSFNVIISNNEFNDKKELLNICLKFKNKFRYLSIYNHKMNIGSLSNLHFLLKKSKTKYFMWLADDDEISHNYLKELKNLLDKDLKVVSAMGRHKMFLSKKNFFIKESCKLSSKNTLFRIINFLISSDDAAFYGLHRTKIIKKCTFEGYYWPIDNIITNVGYIILFQLTLYGRTEYSDNTEWICHNYTNKYHSLPNDSFVKKIYEQLKFPIRRLNVNFLYIKKINDHYKNFLYTALSIPFILIFFLRDILAFIVYFTFRLLKLLIIKI